jgi:hypothetical protein
MTPARSLLRSGTSNRLDPDQWIHALVKRNYIATGL